MGKALGALKIEKIFTFEHEDLTKKSRSGKNESVFGPFGVKKWTKNCLKLVQGVPLGYLEGPDLCLGPLRSKDVQNFENFEPKNWKKRTKTGPFLGLLGSKSDPNSSQK